MPFKFNPLTGSLDLVNASSGGTVTSVTASSPLASSGGTTPNITIQQATTSQDGYLSSTDWNTFNSKQPAGNYITALTGDATASGPGSVPITFATVNANVGSFTLSNITVNAKGLVTAASSTTTGNLTDVGTDGITITNGTAAVLGSGTSISQHVADSTHNGYLSSTDWSTFNNKQPAGNYITALTGDVTAAGPGSSAATLATVNGNVGSFGTASSVGSFTVNAKGLITAASNTAIQITESQVTNLVSDLAAKQSTTLTNTHLLVGNASNVATDVAASGDLTLANTGAFTLNTVNANVGSFGSATATGTFTVNAKGLITAASSTPIQITESQVTNLTTDLAGKQSTTLTNTHILVGNASNVATDVAMSGDATIANTGALTLATVNANVGSFTSANITVNAKGLITAASNGTGGAGVTVLNKSANYTVLSADNGTYFTLDTSGAAFTLTLPTPSSGFHIKFVDSTGSFSTNNLTLAPSSTEKIEGLAASKVFQTNWGGWEVFSNGTDWYIL